MKSWDEVGQQSYVYVCVTPVYQWNQCLPFYAETCVPYSVITVETGEGGMAPVVGPAP